MTPGTPHLSSHSWLWDSVSTTDPSHTKTVKVGARSFTAIDAHYQIWRATQTFGPVGRGWGWDTTFTHIGTKPSAIMAEVALWYYDPELPRSEGRSEPVRGTGCAKYFDGKERFDNDAPKKAETDALTKALSRLGFNADVFLGKFDDNKYVRSLAEEFTQGSQERASAHREAPATQMSRPAPAAPTAAAEPAPASPAPPATRHQFRDNGFTIVSDEALAKAALEPLGYTTQEPRWFAEEIKFGKMRGRTWGDMVKGQRGGSRHSWLSFMACDYDPYRSQDGTPTPEKYLFWNEVRTAQAQACLGWFDQHEPAAEPTPAMATLTPEDDGWGTDPYASAPGGGDNAPF